MPLREIASGLRFPEGPIALPDGTFLVVEIAAGRLTRIEADGRLQVVAELGGGPNGAAIHMGCGRFKSDDLVWVFEGITIDESPEALAWPAQVNLMNHTEESGKSHRRVCVGKIIVQEHA